ncbi:hypothetical protein A3F03_00035 [Candidatus Roizmanbacteria bacterium RIFCSPHIGHO2_12_FULL_41_11]|uniref:ParB/Spo0J HTH domain-containing protein n=2 Tax=Candidatus Roizmaniibacteriota TaxID=1752723 RepID=A0A1F7JRM4_9BACT|nr:MAG: hypothetical protein A3F03_00035 [Candidatus Roizmanbacteria bacterium RIFCSPHIGHO2_12_FULL_41_11]OGK58252.1 MAG: hypothetical protein A3H86_03770 [Candidatus Roizmanbacteria bacterium RIFCSPLOWO2_02_FULL_41_9]
MSESSSVLIEKFKQEKDAFQKAKIIRDLRFQNKLTLDQLSKELQLQPSHISHYLRLLRLPHLVVDGYYGRLVSVTHLMILSRLKTKAAIIQAYETVLARGYSSLQTEELVREMLFGISTDGSPRLSRQEIRDFQRTFHELYPGITVKIIQTRVRGKLVCEIKAGTTISSKILRGMIDKLLADDSGIKRTKKNVFVLE